MLNIEKFREEINQKKKKKNQIYIKNTLNPSQPILSSLSTTSSLKSGSSSMGDGGVSLDLQPQTFLNTLNHNKNNQINNNNNNTHPIIDTTTIHHSNNTHHSKSSSSFDSCIEFSKKSSSKSPSSLGSVCESIGFDSMSYRTKSRGSLSSQSSSSGGDIGPPEYDLGPHREMAVDVPDNFVAVAKVPPRYPSKNAIATPTSTTIATNPLQISKESLLISSNSINTTNVIRNNEVFFCLFFSFLLCLFLDFAFI